MTQFFGEDLVEMIPKLRAYATMLAGSSLEADDLVQDALMRAWRFQSSFQPGTNLRAWLFRILRNEFLSQVRRPRHVEDVDGRYSARLTSAPRQEWNLQYQELEEGLGGLSEEARSALLLVAACGFTYDEAAEISGCSAGTIKSRVSRARDRLLTILEPSLPPTENKAGREALSCRRRVPATVAPWAGTASR